MRIEHLHAVLNYGIDQAETSDINVLDYHEKPAALDHDDQLKIMKDMRKSLDKKVIVKVMMLVADYTYSDDPQYNVSPNVIEDEVYELLRKEGISENNSTDIAGWIFDITTMLVQDVGVYK